jgi:surfeit locus 1 family protein
MSLRIGNRTFAPRAWAAALTCAALATFVSLGSWQLGRAREKQALTRAFEAGRAETIDAYGRAFDELPRYQHVRLRGVYDSGRQILLDVMPSADGQAGYRVLTPLERADGRGRVLVDRGWLPPGRSRDVLPDISVATDEREVSGILDVLPVPGLRVGPATAPGNEAWPRVMLFPTEADVESALGADVEARVILLDSEASDGYERRWRPALGFSPERHLGYAIQWFAFATVAIVIFVALSLRPVSSAEERGQT